MSIQSVLAFATCPALFAIAGIARWAGRPLPDGWAGGLLAASFALILISSWLDARRDRRSGLLRRRR
jgi:hypothetical protein